MTTYQIRSPLAMCACAISGSLSILLLVEPSFNDGFTHRLIVPVAVSIGLVSMAIITGVLAHGHGLWTASGAALAVVSVGLSGAIVWEQSGRRAQTRVTTATTSQDATAERARLVRIRAQSEEVLASCPKGREKDQGIKCGLRDALNAECKGGGGPRCKGIERSIAVNEATVRDYTLQLKGVPTPTPDAKVETISTAAKLSGYDADKARAWVSLIDPLLVPLLLELAAIICGVVAFGPKLAPAVTEIPTQTARGDDSQKSRSAFPMAWNALNLQGNPGNCGNVVSISDEDRIAKALRTKGGEVRSQRHLSIVLGVSPAETCRMLQKCNPERIERMWDPISKSNVIRIRDAS